jgi:hypothetical protein
MTWQDIGTIVGTVGGVCGFYSLYQNHQQTKIAQEQTDLMRDQAKKAKERDDEDRQWALRHEQLASRLSNLTPHLTIAVQGTSNSHVCLYPSVFSDPEFRKRLETYIVQPNPSFTQFTPRKPAPHELQSPNLRETVETAERLIDKFAAENPKIPLMYYLGAEKAPN